MSEYLEHHGVLGMKWGVRRYQNQDGSYKPGAEGRYNPEISGDDEYTIKKGSRFYRTSSEKNDESSTNRKLYVNSDEVESQSYQEELTKVNLATDGKSFTKEYIADNDIKIPSVKIQSEIEKSILDNKEFSKELEDSLISKGMSPKEAKKLIRNYSHGLEYTKNLLRTFSKEKANSLTEEKEAKRLSAFREAQGDSKNTGINSSFETELKKRGYGAYRDLNDRFNDLGRKSSLVIFDSNGKVHQTKAQQNTVQSFSNLYASRKLQEVYGYKTASKELWKNLINEGKQEYQDHIDLYNPDKKIHRNN